MPVDLGALDGLAVLLGHEVDDDEVAVGGRALDVDQGREALAQRGSTCSSTSSSVTATSSTCGGQVVVRREVDLGLDVDLGGELEGLVVLERVTSISGWASGWRSLSCSAWM